MTLLLALFIVLFAASDVDAKKFKAISESFNVELQGGTGLLDQSAPVELDTDTSPFAIIPEEGMTEEMMDDLEAVRDRQELGSSKRKSNRILMKKAYRRNFKRS